MMNDPIEKARWAWLGALSRFESIVRRDDASHEEYLKAKAELERAKAAYDSLEAAARK